MAAAVRGLELARRGRARLETACALLCMARIGCRHGLFVSYGTVKSRARHIYRKLGVSSREQAVSLGRDGYPS